ncbi:MAG: TIM barrel protein, partial [Clostridia bacterium]|nr:TIM barrel protein [Clostridia bacterium]
MKRTFNLTTYGDDLDRYGDREDLLRALDGFDGLELMHCGEDVRRVVPKERIIGVHLCFFPYWYDFYTGDLAACEQNLGSREAIRALYGGDGPEALVDAYRRDIEKARAEGAEYVVFHVADCSDEELFTLRYRHTSGEVAEAAVDLLNTLFPEPEGDLLLLMENLWHPGLTLTEPEVTEGLLLGVRYRNKGIMLDTGHLMHTDLSLRTQAEALAYIRRRIEAQGEVVRRAIRGIHLNQSLTGAYMAETAAHPPVLSADPKKRMEPVSTHAFRCDQHRPFTCPGVRDFIRWIDPEYLTFEVISRSLAEPEAMLHEQLEA